jgi:hypothetical protein
MANLKNRGFLVKTTVGTESSKDSLLLKDKNFNYSITRYPLDLGTANFGKGHYIIFHILQQRQSQYKTQNNPTGREAISSVGLEKRFERQAGGGSVNETAGELLTEVIRLVNGTNSTLTPTKDLPAKESGFFGSLSNLAGAVGGFVEQATGPDGEFKKLGEAIKKPEFVRTIEKSSQAIALYMPDSLNFVQAQGYDDISPGNSFMTALFAGGKSAYDTIKAYNNSAKASPIQLGRNLATNLSPFVASLLGNVLDKMGGNGMGRLLAAAGTGMVTNPMIEVIYSSPSLRQFRFDFMFYPQSYQEGLAVQKIIQSFQFHQAPEIAPNNTSGYFLVPPSEFDIEFYYNGQENVNIPSISTCVLTSMDVDYAPNGFTAYEVPGQDLTYGGTGMPVAIKMSLDFKETSIAFKSSRQFTEDKAPVRPGKGFE